MSGHPVAHLVRTQLGSSATIRPAVAVPPAEFHEVVARYGAGLDHAGGEVPLAVVRAKLDAAAARARDYSACYLVTDRRLFGGVEASNIPLQFVDVPYGYVTGVQGKPGALAQSVMVAL